MELSEAIKWLTKSPVDKYIEIMKLAKTDLSKDKDLKDFKDRFNDFYQIRGVQWHEDWQTAFYKLFQEKRREIKNDKKILEEIRKNKEDFFERIVIELKSSTKRVEVVFASKMLHTLMPECPIWDSLVIKHFKIKVPQNKEKKFEKCKEIYGQIIDAYENMNQKEKDNYIKIFNKTFPKHKNEISDIKKLDFIIWALEH